MEQDCVLFLVGNRRQAAALVRIYYTIHILPPTGITHRYKGMQAGERKQCNLYPPLH